jgi:hypothetical protein
MSFLCYPRFSFLKELPLFLSKAFSFEPSSGEVLLFFGIVLIPFLLCIINLVVAYKNIEKKRNRLRVFGYVTLSWQGLAALFLIFFIPWVGVAALGLIGVQGILMLKSF